MVKKILDFLAFLPKELYVFLISMLPIIELRGAVPVGAAIGLPFYLNYLVAVIGNVLPVPFILMFIPKILDLMEKVKIFRPIVKWVREKAEKYKGKIITVKDESCVECGEDAEKLNAGFFLALMMFVAIPLPGTGAWTGSLIAALLDMKKRYAIPSVFLGVLTAGILMSLITGGVLAGLDFLL